MKLKNLIERIKLSDTDYQNMKEKSQMYDKMMSTIQVEGHQEYEEACDAYGHVVMTFPKAMLYTVNIDVEKMLAAGGITFDKNITKFNVTGF
jgi:hypothetical protein